MKKLRKVLLFIMLFVMACPIIAQAKEKTTTKVTTLKENTWSKQKEFTYTYSSATDTYSYTYYIHKVVIPADGYISLTTNARGSDYYIEFYHSKNINDNTEYVDIEANTITMIEKGTYYVKCYDDLKYKYKFTKSVNKNNYCIAKAISLNSGDKVVVCNTPKYNYNRWYKIVLKKKQSVNIYVTHGDGSYIDVFDGDGNDYEMANDGDRYYTQRKLKAGTYYIRVFGSFSEPLISFSWK